MMLKNKGAWLEFWMSLLKLRVPTIAFSHKALYCTLWSPLHDAQASSGLLIFIGLPYSLLVLLGPPGTLDVAMRLWSTGTANSIWMKLLHHSLEASNSGPLPNVGLLWVLWSLLWHRTPGSLSFSKCYTPSGSFYPPKEARTFSPELLPSLPFPFQMFCPYPSSFSLIQALLLLI